MKIIGETEEVVEKKEKTEAEEDVEIHTLSQNLADSQISNYSDVEKEESDKPELLSKFDLRCMCLLLTCENDIPPEVVNTVITEVNEFAGLSLNIMHRTTMTRHIPVVQGLLDRQAEEIVRSSNTLSLGLDSTNFTFA